jgi:sugar phosphate isomerase/epimerase
MHNHANSRDLHLDDLRSVTEFAGDQVGVLLDTGWALTSEDEPVARIRSLGPRLRALHLRNQIGERPTEWIGEGDIDMADCIRTLKEMGYAGWLTTEIYYRADTDLTRSLVENQARTVELLRKLWAEA